MKGLWLSDAGYMENIMIRLIVHAICVEVIMIVMIAHVIFEEIMIVMIVNKQETLTGLLMKYHWKVWKSECKKPPKKPYLVKLKQAFKSSRRYMLCNAPHGIVWLR